VEIPKTDPCLGIRKVRLFAYTWAEWDTPPSAGDPGVLSHYYVKVQQLHTVTDPAKKITANTSSAYWSLPSDSFLKYYEVDVTDALYAPMIYFVNDRWIGVVGFPREWTEEEGGDGVVYYNWLFSLEKDASNQPLHRIPMRRTDGSRLDPPDTPFAWGETTDAGATGTTFAGLEDVRNTEYYCDAISDSNRVILSPEARRYEWWHCIP